MGHLVQVPDKMWDRMKRIEPQLEEVEGPDETELKNEKNDKITGINTTREAPKRPAKRNDAGPVGAAKENKGGQKKVPTAKGRPKGPTSKKRS